MDMTASIIPKSDQINGDDLMTGPVTVTIDRVSAGSAEQPVDVFLVEFPKRAFRPSKSMRRVLVAAYGPDTSAYTGKRMTLYREPSIRFGANEVGGIRISHLSGIDKSIKLALTVSRGKKEPFTVAPLSNIADKTSDKTVDKKTGEITDLRSPATEFVDNTGDKSADKVTPEQMSTIGELMDKLGMNDQAVKLAYAGDCVEREIKSANELSAHEAARLIAYLQKDVEQIEQTKLTSEANGDE